MKIELRGIILSYDQGHKYVDVVVTEDLPDIYRRLRVGVDIELSRGKIIQFLSAQYDVKQNDIAWPHHILPRDSDI